MSPQQVDNPIFPVEILPENKGRSGQGGGRLLSHEQGESKPTPLISIVTVCLNDERNIEKTMQSVIKQLDAKKEYIIIDGGSTDATREIIKKYDQYLDYWVSEPDNGISDAFNKGIALCRGDVVGLLNSGDWYEPDTLNFVENFFVNQREKGVLCGAVQYWEGERKGYISESRSDMLGSEMSVTHPTCFVRRDLYLEHGGFDTDFTYAMDYELLLRLFVRDVAFENVPEILANMLHDGLSEQYWRDALRETWLARRKHVPGSFFASKVYCGYLVARKYVRFFLQKMGLNGLVRFYKERLAPVKKIMPR